MEQLAEAGRLPNRRKVREMRGQKVAENLIKGGYDQQIVWKTDSRASAPSTTTTDLIYQVDLLHATCTCPASSNEGS